MKFMKFKFWIDAEARKRKRLAAQALSEIRRLSDAQYPLALLFDKFCPPGLERATGEGWPEAYARYLGLDLPHFRDFVQGMITSGLYTRNSETPPSTKDLLSHFRGWSCLLVLVERELAPKGPG